MTETLAETCDAVLDETLVTMRGSRRDGQVAMIHAVCQAIDDSERLLVQAGTGTGKSLGYLIPAMVHSATSGARIVISTATLALQRQIVAKDALVVAEAVAALCGSRPQVALFKGWNNYLCEYRIRGGYPDEGTLMDPALVGESGPTSGLAAEVLSIRQWAEETSTGDRDDLVPGPSEKAWRHVSVSKRECIGDSCPFIDDCFAARAREAAAEADIVVTNHTLVGIDATSESDLFGEVDMVIIDEAHELAERVRSQATVGISSPMLRRIIHALRTHGKAQVEALEEVAEQFDAVLEMLPAGLMQERPEAVGTVIRLLDAAGREILHEVNDSSLEQSSKLLARAAVEELLDACGAWSRSPEQSITWVVRPDLDAGRPSELMVAPMDVAGSIGQDGLREGPAVLTSATLTMGGSFDAIAYECGLSLSTKRWRSLDVGTPFNEAKQGIFYIAQHLPAPGLGGVSDEALDEIVDLVTASQGGALILFSSWKAALAGAEALRERTKLQIFVQGEEAAASLIQQFREDEDSCLVGTLGLWQGVDVPGRSCRLVIMDRIPFPHRDDPVVKALSAHAEKNRKSGFWSVSIPRASLLMAQGAGRLLRSSNDRGMVAVLDNRLVTKSYGAAIRASMPKLWPTTDPQVARNALQRLSATAVPEEKSEGS